MTTSKSALKSVLAKLDLTDDQNWTEDGSPALGVVQRLANDPTITRAQINDANPGFARTSTDQAEKVYAAPAPHDEAPDALIDDLSEDQMRTILNRRINDAEQRLAEARIRVTEAVTEVAQCESRFNRAQADRNRKFPPMTPAANIKAHLASLAASKGATVSPLQEALTGRRRPLPGQPGQLTANPSLPRRSGASLVA